MFGLNEHGWGMKTLIIISSIFLLALIGTAIAIKNISNSMKSSDSSDSSSTTESSYTILEDELKKAGENYTLYHETLINNSTDKILVSLDTLVEEGFINNIIDPDSDSYCDGFVIIDTNKKVKSYLKCSLYKTSEYDIWSK